MKLKMKYLDTFSPTDSVTSTKCFVTNLRTPEQYLKNVKSEVVLVYL